VWLCVGSDIGVVICQHLQTLSPLPRKGVDGGLCSSFYLVHLGFTHLIQSRLFVSFIGWKYVVCMLGAVCLFELICELR
jgi:hypothetical protein